MLEVMLERLFNRSQKRDHRSQVAHFIKFKTKKNKKYTSCRQFSDYTVLVAKETS